MNVEEFVISHRSPKTRHSDAARQEFLNYQDASYELAKLLRFRVTHEMKKQQPNLISREDHFYSSDTKGERFFAFVTPISLKKLDRLAKKLTAALTQHPEIAKDNWWWHAKDLARFRVVTANLSDLLTSRNIIAQIIHDSTGPERLYLRDNVRDYIWTEPNERHNASKSVHFRICDPKANIAEIQVMTLLQYSWDQIQHWLYEIQRASENLSGLDKNVERSYWALSNSLFVLDEYIVSLDGKNPRDIRSAIPFELNEYTPTEHD